MAVSAQIGSVQPLGVKKKKQLYSPLIQEQARSGIATQMVLDRKNLEQQKEQDDFREEQFAFTKEQATTSDEQWKKDYALQEQGIINQQNQWENTFSAQKKRDTWGMVFGGLSTAATLLDAFNVF